MSSQIEMLHKIIDPIAEAMGYEVIRIALQNSARGEAMTLQIMAERPDGSMLVEDCAKLSREISVIMDVEDPISAEYVLEVSTPGIDRPLTRRKDFENYAGYEIKIELSVPEGGRRRFRGKLKGLSSDLSGDLVKIDVDGEVFEVDFNNIYRSKLVLTDELLAMVSAAGK
ncbi:Bacterial ribosome SSU maturation protein RimP [hydrothermal vent metagenome]|uniref:Bacterial ribosome SSU maturation protein RimP n=1 Tax=hydrothermal vent metagenome TaxID=652676 RepID=A0A3B1AV89_9ZZZZ